MKSLVQHRFSTFQHRSGSARFNTGSAGWTSAGPNSWASSSRTLFRFFTLLDRFRILVKKNSFFYCFIVCEILCVPANLLTLAHFIFSLGFILHLRFSKLSRFSSTGSARFSTGSDAPVGPCSPSVGLPQAAGYGAWCNECLTSWADKLRLHRHKCAFLLRLIPIIILASSVPPCWGSRRSNCELCQLLVC